MVENIFKNIGGAKSIGENSTLSKTPPHTEPSHFIR